MNNLDDFHYLLCQLCDHFVYDNPSYDDDPQTAEYIHLDDGETDYDHDATPDNHRVLTLGQWKQQYPQLFRIYDDGHIGPNSRFHIPITR